MTVPEWFTVASRKPRDAWRILPSYIQDAALRSKGRAQRTLIKRERNHEVMNLWSRGATAEEIADRFDLSHCTVYQIIRRSMARARIILTRNEELTWEPTPTPRPGGPATSRFSATRAASRT